MARELLRSDRTGEEIEIVLDTPELLRMIAVWTRPGQRTVRHLHPGMEERWRVLSGRAAVEVDGVEAELEPGSSITAPAGRPHLAWNPAGQPATLQIEMRPALRWAEFTRRLFSGEDPGTLLAHYRDEVQLAPRS